MTKHAIRRLLFDWHEVQANPLPTVSASPVCEDNLFLWHGNLRGVKGSRFENSNFHITIDFPLDYPNSPPRIKMKSGLRRLHVYGEWICLDMLRGWMADKAGQSSSDQFYGWSTAYTVCSILIQLQAYLFDESELYDHHVSIRNAATYKCSKCSHTNGNPWPPYKCEEQGIASVSEFPRYTSQQMKLLKSELNFYQRKSGWHKDSQCLKKIEYITLQLRPEPKVTPQSDPFESKVSDTQRQYDLSQDVTATTLNFLSLEEILRCRNVSVHFRKAIRKFYLVEKRELVCFHRKVGFLSDNTIDTVLGIGITPEYWYKNGSIELNDVYCGTDLLSYGAFRDENVRLTVGKQKFTHFLPLLISHHHTKLAMPLIEKIMDEILGITSLCEKHGTVTPVMKFEFIVTLMQSTVVSLFRRGTENSRAMTAHASECALQGFMACHHMLLAFLQKYPQIVQYANAKVDTFVHNKLERTVEHVPSLRTFVFYLTISDKSWEQVATALLEEFRIRNAKWALMKYPHLRLLEKRYDVSQERIDTCWLQDQGGAKLSMFQFYFLNAVRGATGVMDVSKTLLKYNRSYGRPTQKMLMELQQQCKKILKTENYHEFDSFLKVPHRTPLIICQQLRSATRACVARGFQLMDADGNPLKVLERGQWHEEKKEMKKEKKKDTGRPKRLQGTFIWIKYCNKYHRTRIKTVAIREQKEYCLLEYQPQHGPTPFKEEWHCLDWIKMRATWRQGIFPFQLSEPDLMQEEREEKQTRNEERLQQSVQKYKMTYDEVARAKKAGGPEKMHSMGFGGYYRKKRKKKEWKLVKSEHNSGKSYNPLEYDTVIRGQHHAPVRHNHKKCSSKRRISTRWGR